MDNYDIDEIYEMKRIGELEYEKEYFLHHFSIPDCFRTEATYKKADKYVMELLNNDKKCWMKLEIDLDLYKKVDDIVTGCDIITLSFEDIDHELGIN